MTRPEHVRATLDRERLVITLRVTDSYTYEVDLEESNTCAQILDWVMQIHEKRWPDGALIINDFLDCLNDASRELLGGSIQNRFCSFGKDLGARNWRRGE